MLLVYNSAGLLFGVLGLLAGVLATIATGDRPWVGLLVAGLFWIVMGRRKVDPQTGIKQAFPSIYFIPIPVFGALALLLVLPAFTAGRIGGTSQDDARLQMLSDDERSLSSSQYSGNLILSRRIGDFLADISNSEIRAERISVFTRLQRDRVLVLLQAQNLSKFSDNARRQLLEAASALITGDKQYENRQVYVGAKGRLLFGAARTPNGQISTATGCKDLLLPFYDATAASTPTSQP
jgi:hypothetical protein